MEIKTPELMLTGIKAARGFSGEAYISRNDTFVVGTLATLEGVALKAEEETPVAVDVANLPPNANIRNITATFTVTDDQKKGAGQTTSVGISEGQDKRNFQVSVDAVAGIRNVQIRLDQGLVFWTHPGVVRADAYTIPNFSAQANAYLDKFQSKDGKVTLQFLVKSDVAGLVQISINDGLQYSLLQTQSWKNDLDSTYRVDRTLKLTFNQVERLAIDAVAPPAGRRALVSAVRLDAGGQFGTDRLLGAVEVSDGRQFATVSQDFSIAQNVTPVKELLKTAVQCTGVAGYFQADQNAEFYVELQNDQSGSPASDTPLAKSNIAFTPSNKNDPQPWTFAKFEKPAQLKPDTPYWIVVKGVRGIVRLGLKTPAASNGKPNAPVTRGGVLLNRGGQIWKSLGGSVAPSLEALLSLVYVAQPDNQTAAVEISVGEGGAAQRLDPQSAARTITFPLSGTGAPVLVIDSRALGSLTIANVIQEYTLS